MNIGLIAHDAKKKLMQMDLLGIKTQLLLAALEFTQLYSQNTMQHHH